MSTASVSSGTGAAQQKTTLPPYAYFIAGALAGVVYIGATAVQLQTSELWIETAISGAKVTDALMPHFSVFTQVFAFWYGGLTQEQVVPYIVAWGIQAALVLFSIGLEVPHVGRGRAELFGSACLVMIVVNSLGDWNYASMYGFWGQVGFTGALFVMTFCFGFASILAVARGIAVMRR